MVEDGLVAEVSALIESGVSSDSTAMQGLGYKEIAAYLDGKYSLDEAIETIKRSTRRFVKRQYTWFKADVRTRWFDVYEMDSLRVAEAIACELESVG